MSNKDENAENPSNTIDPFEMIDALDKSAQVDQESAASTSIDSSMEPTKKSNDSNLPDIEEGRARVRDNNWPKAVRYDYSVYNVKPEDEDISMECLGEKSSAEPNNGPDWLHNAAKYEWDEKFGEVGPEVPELEEQLFNSKHIVRRGNDIQALEFEVKLEGPTPVRPVRQVGLSEALYLLARCFDTDSFTSLWYSSRILVSIQSC